MQQRRRPDRETDHRRGPGGEDDRNPACRTQSEDEVGGDEQAQAGGGAEREQPRGMDTASGGESEGRRDEDEPAQEQGRGDERLQVEPVADRSEEHTSELQSLMRISYADFCLKKNKPKICKTHIYTP